MPMQKFYIYMLVFTPISIRTIQPSLLTPPHLRYYQLSFLEQRMILTPTLLKQSLSDVLMRYYPLAGRIKDNLIVDCNYEGVLYYEAQVKCQLSAFRHCSWSKSNRVKEISSIWYWCTEHTPINQGACIVKHKNMVLTMGFKALSEFRFYDNAHNSGL